jgi:hypothetical protein
MAGSGQAMMVGRGCDGEMHGQRITLARSELKPETSMTKGRWPLDIFDQLYVRVVEVGREPA